MQARLVGLSLSVTPNEAAYLPLGHRYQGAPEQLELNAVLARLRPWFEDASKPKVGQNLKYDAHVLANHGISSPASPTTPCSSPTCWRATVPTTWTPWRSAISG